MALRGEAFHQPVQKRTAQTRSLVAVQGVCSYSCDVHFLHGWQTASLLGEQGTTVYWSAPFARQLQRRGIDEQGRNRDTQHVQSILVTRRAGIRKAAVAKCIVAARRANCLLLIASVASGADILTLLALGAAAHIHLERTQRGVSDETFLPTRGSSSSLDAPRPPGRRGGNQPCRAQSATGC